MTPVFGSRKRADEFNLLLSRSTVTSREEVERYDDLLQLITTLREIPAPDPRADFSSDLRARLMIAAESALAPDTPEQRSARRATPVHRAPRERRLVAAVGGFAVVSATASMAVAAQSALPGDTLYPLKRAIENAQAGVQRDADGKGTTLLENASGRLDEVDVLSRSGDAGSAISATLEDFAQQASEASDLLLGDYASTGQASSIEELRSFTADSMGALTGLQDVIPEDARAALIEAAQVINTIDVQAQSLCPACTDLPIMQAPVFAQGTIDTLIDEALGPVVAPVVPAGKAPDEQQGNNTDRQKGKDQDKGKGQDTTRRNEDKPEQVAPPTQSEVPADPAFPQGPTGSTAPDTDDADTGGKKGGRRGPLRDIPISGSEDPIGDLLTGVDGTVDKAVKGIGGPNKS